MSPNGSFFTVMNWPSGLEGGQGVVVSLGGGGGEFEVVRFFEKGA